MKCKLLLTSSLLLISTTFLTSCNNSNISKIIKQGFKQNNLKLSNQDLFQDKNINFQINSSINHSLQLLKDHHLLSDDIIFKKQQKTKKKINLLLEKTSKKAKLNYKKQSLINKQDALLFERLVKQEKENKEQEKRHKIIATCIIITSSIVAGATAGLSAYFGLKNINSNQNNLKQELEQKVKEYKFILSQTNKNDSLSDVLNKVINLSFEKNLPKAIFELLKTTIFKEYLQDFENKQQEILILQLSNIKFPIQEILNDFNMQFFSENLLKNNFSEIIKTKIKDFINDVIKKYLPILFRSLLNFISTSAKDKQNSMLGRIFQKILQNFKVEVNNISNLSFVLNTYAQLLATNQNQLIEHFTDAFTKSIKDTDFQYDLINDFYNVINQTIKSIFSKENGDFDLEKFFRELLPKILSSLKIDDSKSYANFTTFINEFLSNTNNENKWIKSFVKTGNFISGNTTELSNLNLKRKSLIFPKFSLSLENIFLALKNVSNISNTIKQILELFFKPLIIELKKNVNDQNIKKAIFRLSSLLSFIYYKYASYNKVKILRSIITTLNPFEPERYLVEFLENLIKEQGIRNINLDLIFGKNSRPWTDLFRKKYDIFSDLKEVAKNSNNAKSDKVLKAFEEGVYK